MSLATQNDIWVQTLTGGGVHLDFPDSDHIHLRTDIATALSRIPRFNGHTRFAYSVAQHSALGAAWLSAQGRRREALIFLLHDAHEAYLGDIASPVIAAVCDPVRLERARTRLDRAIWRIATGRPDAVAVPLSFAVAEIDLRMLRTERDQICAAPFAPWGEAIETAEPLPILISPWSERQAREHWIGWLDELTGKTIGDSA